MKIAPQIAYQVKENGKKEYRFKIVNKTFWSRITDVRIELYLKTPIDGVKGDDLKLEIVEDIEPSFLFDINRNSHWLGFRLRKDKYDSYAWRPRVDRPLEKVLEERKNQRPRLELKVTARHGLSGYFRVIEHTFDRTPSPFVKGIFMKGNNVDIHKN